MPFSFTYLPHVKGEIARVIDSTETTLGARQAGIYDNLIERALESLVDNPYLCPLRPEIHPEARIFHLSRLGMPASHLFLYRVRGEVVELAAFLYDGMALELHVPYEWES